MTIATPLGLRWERARQIDRATIEDMGQGWFYVPSSREAEGYAVQLEFDIEGKLMAATCTCPDFEKRIEGMAAPILHGVRVCKHVHAASLKARAALPQSPMTKPDSGSCANSSSTLVTVSPAKPIPVNPGILPTAGEPVWDETCREWVLTDSTGLHHCGASPSECTRQFEEARHYQAEHARKDRTMIAKLSDIQAQDVSERAATEQAHQPAKVVQDADRRCALSRARGIANQARSPRVATYRLYGVGEGDVLDWLDQSMFLAVITVTSDYLVAQGIVQSNPSGAPREIRMAGEMLHLRLQNGWLTKVRNLKG